MKIALCQINPKIGDLQGNSEKIITYLNKVTNCDLVVFPELSLCGYPPKDLLLQEQFVDKCWKVLEETIVPQVTVPTLIGLPLKDKNLSFLYNSVAFIKNKRIEKVIHKKLLPNYEVFFESRYFQPSQIESEEDSFIEIKNKKLAVMICEDFLAGDVEEKAYGQNLIGLLKKKQIASILCLAASPFRKNIKPVRIKHAIQVSEQLSCPILLVNQVGANDDLIFDGNSFFVNKLGQLESCSKNFEEDLLICNLDSQTISRNEKKNKKSTQEYSSLDKPEDKQEIKKALILGIKDYFQKTGFSKALIGISGGIDSALVACLAKEALGAKNVTGVLMPSVYSSEGSVLDAQNLLKNLGVASKRIGIQPILESFLKQTGIQKLTKAEENLQSRVRGNILMALANQDNALVLATGNKSEFAVGYSTLYGDCCGALAPIGDLWKTQVWEISKTFPEIPLEIIQKPPSAELRPDQLDTDSLPDYETLDRVLSLIIENHFSEKKIVQMGFEEKTVKKIFHLLSVNEFKRRQAPIILKVSFKAFGSGWVYPIAKAAQ
ncbi:MAG: NAD+ synthase [Candidatus Caenarcaniphilales bacterium]|nr:NAD+ synthase [Candidatus Caenarcaniphilales bacterium]